MSDEETSELEELRERLEKAVIDTCSRWMTVGMACAPLTFWRGWLLLG